MSNSFFFYILAIAVVVGVIAALIAGNSLKK